MQSGLLFPRQNSPIYTAMHEPNSGNNAAFTGGAAALRRPNKPPQPPLYIPPGHVAFRLLCHASRIGGLIGKSGSIIKQLQYFTNSRIRVEDPLHSSDNRVISVVASPVIVKQIKLYAATAEENNGYAEIGGDGEEALFDVSAAQEGIVRVFERVVDVAAEGDAAAGIGGVVSCRLLVNKFQGGAVIGKGGHVVEKIRKDTRCRIKVLPVENNFSNSSSMDEIVEIEGLGLDVKKALVAVTSRLQEFPPPEETMPNPIVDLPLQRSTILQPTPSNYTNHSRGGGMNSTIPQQEVVFKILCPNEHIGGIIGKGGSVVKAIQHESGASVSIGLNVADCDERLIIITAMESVESKYSPAQKATVAVFTRFTALVMGFHSDPKESPVSARIMVASNQVGCLLGKGGAIISEMRKATHTSLRILGGDQVPKCASENEEVLQITGDFANVQDALYKVTGRLRDHMFSTKMLTGNRNHNFLRTHNDAYGLRNRPAFGSHQSLVDSEKSNEHKSLTQSMDHLTISSNNDNKSLTQSMDHLTISSNNDRFLPPTSFTSMNVQNVTGVNQVNIMATGRRLASDKNGEEIGSYASSGNGSAIGENTVTVEIVVPDAVIGSISGDNNSDFARLQQISGANVTVQEPHPGTTQRTIVISGTAHETQAAQSLLQAFILSES